MDKRGVQIPVSVVNAQQAAAEIAALKARIAELEAAQEKANATSSEESKASEAASAGKTKLATETKRASDELFDFDRKGEKLVKGTLAQLNPDLANAADMAIDLSEGISKISPALLGVAGAGAAIGVVIMWMNALAEATRKAAEERERLNKAMAEAAGRGVEARTDTADALAKAGVDPGRTVDALQRMQDLGAVGVRRDVAQKVAISELLSEGTTGQKLTTADRDALLAGVATNAGFSLSGDNTKDLQSIRSAINAGRDATRQEFARRLFEQTRSEAIKEAPTGFEVMAAQHESGASSLGAERLDRDRPDLTDRDRKAAVRLLQGESEADVFGIPNAPAGLRPGTDRTVGELRNIVETMRRRFEDAPPGVYDGGRIQIINNYNTTNVATQLNGQRPTPSMEAIEQGMTP